MNFVIYYRFVKGYKIELLKVGCTSCRLLIYALLVLEMLE